MANFNELIKYYRQQVTNQDPDEYEESAAYAAESIEGIASKYAKKVDADMTMSTVIQAVAQYLDEQDFYFEKRKARDASIAQDAQSAQGNNEGVEEEAVEPWSTERVYISDIENYTGKDDIGSADKTYVFKKDTGEVVVGGKSVDVYKWLIKNFDSEEVFYKSHELNNYVGVGPDFVPDRAIARAKERAKERAKAKSEKKISSLSEGYKQEIVNGLKKILR